MSDPINAMIRAVSVVGFALGAIAVVRQGDKALTAGAIGMLASAFVFFWTP